MKRRRKINMNAISDIRQHINGIDKRSLFGASALGFPDKISPPRVGMFVKHTSQRVVLTDPEFPRLYGGAENAFGDRSSWNVKAEHDYEIMKTFVKFPNKPNVSPIAYIVRDKKTNKYKCIVYTLGVNLVEKYGFRMYDLIRNNFKEGDTIPKATALMQSSSYVKDNYCAGRNLKTIHCIIPELTEDSIVFSKSAAKAMEYDMVDKVTAKLTENQFFLNMYGDVNIDKPFPEIGEYVKDDEVILSVREDGYLSSRAEACVPHINDKKYHSKGMVFDIDIMTNVPVENEMFNRYYGYIYDWYNDIYSYLKNIVADPYQDDTSIIDMFSRASKFLNEKIKWATKQEIIDTQIVFYVLQHKHIAKGQKVVGRCGNKSVISEIWDDDKMPKTADGKPVDVLSNALAPVKRIVAFVLYESEITSRMEKIHNYIKEQYENGTKSVDELMNIVIDFVSIFNPDEGSDIAKAYHTNPEKTFNDILKNGLYIQITALNDVCTRDAILEADERFGDITPPDKLYTRLAHRWMEQPELTHVGYQYMYVLKQEPSKSSSAVATGRTTLYDAPLKSDRYKHHKLTQSDNAIRFGEYDSLNFEAGISPRKFSIATSILRGSQYTDNSMLMSHLNGVPVDLTRHNKFPQVDKLKAQLKFGGYELRTEPCDYRSIGCIDVQHDVKIGNVNVLISTPELRYVMMMYSHYLHYEESLNGRVVDLNDFYRVIEASDVFDEHDDQKYVDYICHLFESLKPTLDQLKNYD